MIELNYQFVIFESTMAAEVRAQILNLLAQEPQTPSIIRQIDFLKEDLARLEALPVQPGIYLIKCIFFCYFLRIFYISIDFTLFVKAFARTLLILKFYSFTP